MLPRLPALPASRLLRFLLAVALAPLACLEARPAAPKLLRPQADTVALWDFTKADATRVRDLGPARISLRSSDPGTPLVLVEEGDQGGLLFEHSFRLVPEGSFPPIALPSNQLTVEAWLRPAADAAGKQMGIFQYGQYTIAGFRLLVERTGRVAFLVQTGSAEVRLLSEDSLPLGRWTHLAATYDGERIRLFIDGVSQGELLLRDAVIQPENNSHFAIGYVGAGSAPYFRGVINSIRISSTARTSFELN